MRIDFLRVLRSSIAFVTTFGLAIALVAPPLCGATESNDAGVNHEREAVARLVPASIRKFYGGYSYFSSVAPNPYASWKAPKPPWQFCYNDSYQGNSWRAAALAEYQKLVTQYMKAGLAKGELVVTNLNNNIDVQLSQLNTLVRQGCNVVLSIPSSPTGLCSGVKSAHDKGVLFIAVESPVTCPEAMNIDFNEYYGGMQTARWLVHALNGKGNVILLNGIPGLAPTVARRQAALDVFKGYPDIKIVGEVTGMWTPSVAKSAMLQFLATHPQKIDAVWDSGLTGVAAAQALMQSGRPEAKINGLPGDCSFIAYWQQHHLDSFSLSQGGAPAVYEAFVVAARMLNGQQPAVSTVLYPLPEITNDNLHTWYKPTMTVQSNCFADPPDGRVVPDAFFDPLFKGGRAPDPAPQP